MKFLPMGPTAMLNTFQNTFKAGQSYLLDPALSLLAILSLITLTWSALQWTFDESSDALKEMLKKIIFIGFFVWMVKEFPWLTDQLIKGFVWAGTKAGNSSNVSLMDDPSAIMFEGLRVCAYLMKDLARTSIIALPLFILNLSQFIFIILCFVIIAIQVFLVQVEFGIIATLGLILIPFGVITQTAFIAEKVFGAIISYGVKLMVLAFILSISYPVLHKLALPDEPDLFAFTNTFAAAAMLAFLSWHAPAMAAGLISGSPSLSAQNVSSGVSKVFNSVRQIATGAVTGGPKGAALAATKVAAQEVGNIASGGTATASATRPRPQRGSYKKYKGRHR